MGLFEREPRKAASPKAPEEKRKALLARAKAAAESSAKAWLKEHFFPEGDAHSSERAVDAYVEDVLSEHIHKFIFTSAGFKKESFHRDEPEVSYQSPLHKMLVEASERYAKILADRYIKAAEQKITKIPEKLQKAMNKVYEESYSEALLEAAQQLGKERAEADAVKLIGRVAESE